MDEVRPVMAVATREDAGGGVAEEDDHGRRTEEQGKNEGNEDSRRVAA